MSDIVIANGVVHVIDNVLVNGESDPEAASSAQSSYAAEATQTTSMGNGAGGVVGPTSAMGTAGPSGSSTSAPANAANKVDFGLKTMVGSVAAVLGGLAVGAAML